MVRAPAVQCTFYLTLWDVAYQVMWRMSIVGSPIEAFLTFRKSTVRSRSPDFFTGITILGDHVVGYPLVTFTITTSDSLSLSSFWFFLSGFMSPLLIFHVSIAPCIGEILTFTLKQRERVGRIPFPHVHAFVFVFSKQSLQRRCFSLELSKTFPQLHLHNRLFVALSVRYCDRCSVKMSDSCSLL